MKFAPKIFGISLDRGSSAGQWLNAGLELYVTFEHKKGWTIRFRNISARGGCIEEAEKKFFKRLYKSETDGPWQIARQFILQAGRNKGYT